MRWNAAEGECQFYMDVDCSQITYDTAPSQAVLSAVDRANAALAGNTALGRLNIFHSCLIFG